MNINPTMNTDPRLPASLALKPNPISLDLIVAKTEDIIPLSRNTNKNIVLMYIDTHLHVNYPLKRKYKNV